MSSTSPPTTPPRGDASHPPIERVREIRALLDGDRYRDAWAHARELGALGSWRGAEARVIAGRLAWHLGSTRLGAWLHRQAAREHPEHPEAVLAGLRLQLHRMGPFATWPRIEAAAAVFAEAAPQLQAERWALRATVSALLRDFETAALDLERAFVLSDHPYLFTEQAYTLEREDRLDAALAAVDAALSRQPWYRPAIQHKAHLLQAQGREDEALWLLFQATRHVDYPFLHWQLAQSQVVAELWADAEASLEAMSFLAPLLPTDREARDDVEQMRALIAYHRGDVAHAADLHAAGRDRRLKPLVARLRDASAGRRRRVLEVPWVRQHHDTCSPATLAAICRYWHHPAEHLEIAEQICYGGTPAHSERCWALQNGLLACELTVDWRIAVELLERGVPFTLVTADAANAHLQAVVGYDELRRSFLCRDPSTRHLAELDADRLLEALRSTGPRGMVLLPPAEAARLGGLELPERELYDLYGAVEENLARHDRDRAVARLEALRAVAAEHRLLHLGRLALATYDGNIPGQVAAVDALLLLFPDDQRFHTLRIGLLAERDHRQDRIAAIRACAAKPAADPLFSLLLAAELVDDARAEREVDRLLHRGLRLRPDQARGYHTAGRLAWSRGEREHAVLCFRWAACLAEVQEGFQASYFTACRQLGRLEEALALLTQRVERLGGRAGLPAITLASALEVLDRHDEALATIERALALRPDDVDLLLHRASLLLRRGQAATARATLEMLAGRCPPARWLGLRATLAELEDDRAAALADLRALVELDPTSVELHARIATLIGILEGPAAAMRHLEEVVDRFPHHVGLVGLLGQWSWRQGAAAVVAVLRRHLEVEPDHAWAHRELAAALVRIRDLESAEAAWRQALALEPSAPALANVRGLLDEEAGRLPEALESYRRAIREDPDNVWAIGRLAAAGRSAEAQREALRWTFGQLERCATGDGVTAFYQVARRFLPPDELLQRLRELRTARPELAPVWAAIAQQLAQVGRYEEAAEAAAQAIDRFPFLPHIRRAAAEVHCQAGRPGDEMAVLRALLEIEPAQTEARVRLARLLIDDGQLAAARREAELGRNRDPLDPTPLLILAELDGYAEQPAAAIAHLETAIDLEPSSRDAWESLAKVAASAGQPDRALARLRTLLDQRPDEAILWSVLADLTQDARQARRAADRALELAPRAVELHLHKVQLLTAQNDLAAAFAACRPAIYGEQRPTALLGQEAFLQARQGNLAAAIRTMQRAVEADPGYAEGLGTLAEWHHQRGEWQPLSEVAGAWMALVPNEPRAPASRGEARFQLGERDAAKEDFARALRLDPAYTFAGLRLASLQAETGEPGSALATLDALLEKHSTSAALAMAVRIAATQGGHPHLGRWLQALAIVDEGDKQAVGSALAAIVTSLPAMLGAWDEAAFVEQAHPAMAWVRLERIISTEGFDTAWGFLSARDDGQAPWGRAAAFLLVAEYQDRGSDTVLKRIKRCKQQLARVTESWGVAGEILFSSGHSRAAIRWLQDYKGRPRVKAWMLASLSVAHRCLDQRVKAYEASRYALELEDPCAGSEPYHRLWVAFWEAAQGDATGARGLGDVVESDLSPSHRVLYRGALALAEVVGRRGDREAFRRARQQLRGGGRRLDLREPLDRLTHGLARVHVAREVGGVWPWVWALIHGH